jgi:hypothetical protein
MSGASLTVVGNGYHANGYLAGSPEHKRVQLILCDSVNKIYAYYDATKPGIGPIPDWYQWQDLVNAALPEYTLTLGYEMPYCPYSQTELSVSQYTGNGLFAYATFKNVKVNYEPNPTVCHVTAPGAVDLGTYSSGHLASPIIPIPTTVVCDRDSSVAITATGFDNTDSAPFGDSIDGRLRLGPDQKTNQLSASVSASIGYDPLLSVHLVERNSAQPGTYNNYTILTIMYN